MTKNSTIIVII